jgi:hypothetical protein
MRKGKMVKAVCVKNRRRQLKPKQGRKMRNLSSTYNVRIEPSQLGRNKLVINWNDPRPPYPELGAIRANIIEMVFDYDFNQPLDDYMIPRSVKLLRLGDLYSQPIDPRLLARLDMLVIPDTYQFVTPPPERLKIRRYHPYSEEEEQEDFEALGI